MSKPLPPSGFSAFSTDDDDTPAPYTLNNKVMVGAIILLFLVIFFILILHVYAKWFMRRSSQSYVISRSIAFSSLQGAAASAKNNTGLDKATIAQLPTFVYTATSPLDNIKAGKSDESCTRSSLECAVCLSEFQEYEKGRILPACKHAFHTECIDMWLFSHSTCPLCRANVAPTMATSAEIASTHEPHRPQEAMEHSAAGTTEGNSVTLDTVEYPRNVILWGNQMQVSSSSQETSTSSLPVSSSVLTHGARALPHITIEIPPAEGNMVPSTSGHLSAKCTTEQEAGYSQQLKSPGFRVSIKRMLSRQSSGHKSSSQENNIEESHK